MEERRKPLLLSGERTQGDTGWDKGILNLCKALLLEGRAGLILLVVAQVFQPVP